jgi:hypothetical protein
LGRATTHAVGAETGADKKTETYDGVDDEVEEEDEGVEGSETSFSVRAWSPTKISAETEGNDGSFI